MTLLAPLGLLWGLLAFPIVAMHILRPTRPTVQVSSTLHWRPEEMAVSAAKPWQRLRRSLPLLFQLLAVGLLALVAAKPATVRATSFGTHTVFLVDTSASMSARMNRGASSTRSTTRLTEAQQVLRSLRSEIPNDALVSIVTLEAQPQVMVSASPDPDAFGRAVAGLRAAPGRPNVALGAVLAQGLQSIAADTRYVLISDGDFTDADRRMLPPLQQFVQVGGQGGMQSGGQGGRGKAIRVENASIANLTVFRQGATARVVAAVRNYGPSSLSLVIAFRIDGVDVTRRELALDADATTEVALDVPLGTVVTAELYDIQTANGRDVDAFANDNVRSAVVDDRRPVRVLVVGPDDPNALFLDRALAALPGVDAQRVPTFIESAPPAFADGSPADLVVADRTNVPDRIDVPVLAIAPPAGAPGIRVVGEEADVAATFVQADDPLVVGLDFADVAAGVAQKLTMFDGRTPIGDDAVVIGGVRAPLLVRSDAGRAPLLYFTFALHESSLPLDIAFPVVIDRAIRELSSTSTGSASVEAGSTIPLPPAPTSNGMTRVTRPNGSSFVKGPDDVVVADALGVWAITADRSASNNSENVRRIAVHESASESALRTGTVPVEDLPRGGGKRSRSERSVASWFLMPLLAVLVAEWLALRRRRGVSQSQWKVARVLRVALGTATIVAIFAPTITRPTRDIAVVFAIDASDSLGPDGRNAALNAVADALREAPTNARAGVVLFGGSSRVVASTQRGLRLSGATTVIDATRTDIAAALRLAGAIAPSDAARRVVLVSDGRRTVGDDLAAASALSDQRIRVDAVAVGERSRADAAVMSVRAPTTARPGEAVDLRVAITATQEQTRSLEVRFADQVLATSVVNLRVGDNEFSLSVDAPDDATTGAFEVRLGETIGAPTSSEPDTANSGVDAVAENDVARAATSFDGPTKVLIIEGRPGIATALERLLRQGALEVDRLSIDDIPSLDRLGAYASIVMVDVHGRNISEERAADLNGAVRELGIGLVVLGGTDSFGSGEYLGSSFESLLPVVSEVDDPLRRKPVAQVFIIDVSGSMSEAVDGQKTKLDLAKAASFAAITSMQPGDRVGILAVDDGSRWAARLQDVPSDKKASELVGGLMIGGGTELKGVLTKAAAELRKEKNAVKHVMLLTDGFTAGPLSEIADEAARLRAEGITVSVIGAGDTVETSLPDVARRGGGRYIPGTDFRILPKLFVSETQVVQRNLVTEGTFVPTIMSGSPIVRDLASVPPLIGYQATTARPTARTLLRVGDERDPLLASWQAGSGRVSAWTSDVGERWATSWTSWDQAQNFWSALVKDSFALKRAGTVRTTLRDDRLRIVASGEVDADAVTATATVRGPESVQRVDLVRAADGTFVGEAVISQQGAYAVGVRVGDDREGSLFGSGIALRGYSTEYRPLPIDTQRLERISQRTGGRGIIRPDEAFDDRGLRAGSRRVSLTESVVPLLAALLLAAVFASRVAVRGRTARAFAFVARLGRLAIIPLRSAVRPVASRVLPRATRMRARARNEATRARTSVGVSTRGPMRSGTGTATEVQLSPPDPPPVSDTLGRLLDRTRDERDRS